MIARRRRVFLLDVEGTIAPISLVSEQLFPHARAHFEEFLKNHLGDPGVQENLALLRDENWHDHEPGVPRIVPLEKLRDDPDYSSGMQAVSSGGTALREAELKYLFWLMDRDRKSTALKSLQGKIWKAGFESGELKGTLFADVPEALKRWAARGQVAIYSSGSVEAQRLLFRHSIFGDLTALLAAHFDARTGPKAASASYATIATAMSAVPEELLFFSDVVQELDAAREAGCVTRLVVREGNAPVEDAHGHEIVESFEGVL
jgi:2,3-diketo-5-methylthio-1-phosphopentane phosphatase